MCGNKIKSDQNGILFCLQQNHQSLSVWKDWQAVARLWNSAKHSAREEILVVFLAWLVLVLSSVCWHDSVENFELIDADQPPELWRFINHTHAQRLLETHLNAIFSVNLTTGHFWPFGFYQRRICWIISALKGRSNLDRMNQNTCHTFKKYSVQREGWIVIYFLRFTACSAWESCAMCSTLLVFKLHVESGCRVLHQD